MSYHGIYRGICVNTLDPQMKGRIQVQAPGISGDISNWAEPCRDYGSKAVPPVGARIWLMFEAGDAARPVWIGCSD